MPFKYHRKTSRSSWTTEAMQRAVSAVNKKGLTIRAAARQFEVPYGTLQDRLKKRFREEKLKLGRKSIFTKPQEVELVRYILKMSDLFYGLTPKNVRKIAYDFAKTNKIPNRFNEEKGMAGKDWFYAFLKRNPELTIRKPESTSLNRILAFNEEEVLRFYNNLENLMTQHNFRPERIFNVDETGITCVHRPSRILARKGQKQVGSVASGERGQTTTVVCCIGATGLYVPPMFIFKRKRMKEGLSKNGPLGSVYKCSANGWITEELFFEWLQHFAIHVKPTIEDPVLVIMDNHSTHSSLDVFNFCRTNGIKIISLPPHSSHRLQPLDVCFYGPLKTAYHDVCDQYIKSKNYERIQVSDIAELFAKAYNRVASIEKCVKGFQVTGIYPLDKTIFSKEDFVIPQENINPDIDKQELIVENKTTKPDILSLQNIDDQLAGPSNKNLDCNVTRPDNMLDTTPPHSAPLKLSLNANLKTVRKSRKKTHLRVSTSSSDFESDIEEVFDSEATDDEDKSVQMKNKSFEEICPLPVLRERNKSRRKQHSEILTSTPFKNILEDKEKKKATNTVKKIKLSSVKRKISGTTVPGKEKSATIKSNENEKCHICDNFGTNNDMWWRCRGCGNWAHADCTSAEIAAVYLCDFCSTT